MLCALDFAMADSINKAVLKLVRQQVLGAVACLPVSDLWPHSARLLQQEVRATGSNAAISAKIGMQLSLTGAFSPLSSGFVPANRIDEGALPSKKDLITAARFGGLEPLMLESEFRTQIKRFMAHMGKPPAFILLEEAMIFFGSAATGVSASLAYFNLTSVPIVVPSLPRPQGLRERLERRVLWGSDQHQSQPWNRRMLVDVNRAERLPPKSSWLQDTKIWYIVRPALEDAGDRARLDRFDQDPDERFEQMNWFCGS